MATRLGIELTSAACRIIEIDTGSGWRRARAPRVRSFAVLPSSGPEIGARLASYKGRAASVIVWGPYNAHRQVVVTRGTYESMRTDALESLSRAGVETRGVFVDIAPVGPSGDKAERRPVVVALAAATPIMSALQPIIDAGIRVRSVATPATALSSLARLRRSLDAPGIEAYVAVEEDATCIAPLPPPRVLEDTPAAVPPREVENRPVAPSPLPPATTSRSTEQSIPLARSTAPPAASPPVEAGSQSETPQVSTPPRASPQPILPKRPETDTPFEAELGTILYSADRKLAIVDGRIVTVGDDVRGARIVDITPSAVLLRDGQGRLRRLGLSTAGK